jgi:hypothetical protein
MHWCNVADEAQHMFACVQAYPENEVAWLMITAWNAGVEFHRFANHSRMRFYHSACALLVELDNFISISRSLMHHQKAQKWCSIAIRLLDKLSSLKPCYHAMVCGPSP